MPASDVAVTISGLRGRTGEAMAIGERPAIALLDAPASGRMAVGEAITNIAAADVRQLGDVKLSANWMAACGEPGEDADLYDTVRAIGEELCPALGIAIPVGKDSLSMRTTWRADGAARSVVAPLSLVITAFAPVAEVRRTLTPVLDTAAGPSQLLLVDLGAAATASADPAWRRCTAASATCRPTWTMRSASFHSSQRFRELRDAGLILAYHDRSDGGLAVTLLEMAFCGSRSASTSISATSLSRSRRSSAKNSAPSCNCVSGDLGRSRDILERHGLGALARRIGQVTRARQIRIAGAGRLLIDEDRVRLRALWSETSWRMQRLRDDAGLRGRGARRASRRGGPGPQPGDSDSIQATDVAAPFIATGVRPRVAVLREQGVNSQVEMAAAFDRAGFTAVDVHMTDLIDARRDARGLPRARRLRRLQLRRRAGRGRGLGEIDPVQCPRARVCSRPGSSAKTASRSASAMAARCWLRWPN